MSDVKEAALNAAIAYAAKAVAPLSSVEIVDTAKMFETYLTGADTPKATKAAKETKAAKTENAPAGAAASGAVSATATVAATGPTREQIVPVFQDVANKVSRDAAVALLTKYGAATFAGVKPEQYAAFLADCQAALNPPADTGAGGLI